MTSDQKVLLHHIRQEFRKTAMPVTLTKAQMADGKALVNAEQCFYCGDFDRVMPYDRGED